MANFLHKSLLTKRQVTNVCKAFEKNLWANIKLSKAQISKTIQSGWFVNRFVRP